MSNGNSKNKIVWSLIVGFILGLLVGLVLFYERGGSPETINEELNGLALDSDELALSADDDRQPLETESVFVDSEFVNVKDQMAGNEVFISRVELKQSGWVAIQEDVSGEPGNILGARRFDAGVYQGTVNLLRTTQAGDIYHATLWHDDGDKVFNHDSDTLLLTAEGMSFEAF